MKSTTVRMSDKQKQKALAVANWLEGRLGDAEDNWVVMSLHTTDIKLLVRSIKEFAVEKDH